MAESQACILTHFHIYELPAYVHTVVARMELNESLLHVQKLSSFETM